MCIGRHRAVRLAGALAVVAVTLLAGAGPAAAHPLGNFTVNTYSGVVVRTDAVEIKFVLDMAEIPTFQKKSEIDVDGDGRTDGVELAAFRRTQCADIRRNLELRVDDQAATFAMRSTELTFPKGQAGLTTLRLTCALEAATDLSRGGRVTYASRNLVDRTGWREISVAGDRVRLHGSGLRSRSVSAELTGYPTNLLQAPLDERSVAFTVTPGGPPLIRAAPVVRPPASPLPRGVDRATKAFTSFVARQRLTLGFGLVAVGLSALLGAIHAFAPGHGKTVMAAYLVGQEGSMRQAGIIAVTVTLTHTIGVLVLGVAISASTIVAPEKLYPYLGLASGLMLAAIGAGLLARAWRRRASRTSPHGHDSHAHEPHDPHHSHDDLETHSHGGHTHSHGPINPGRPITWGSMLAIGFVGGFLPSPSAVVVILGAIALHRTWFGVVLVLAYGVGMALTLTGAGLLLLKTRGALARRQSTAMWRQRLDAFDRLLPTLTGAVIVTVGLVLAAQALTKV